MKGKKTLAALALVTAALTLALSASGGTRATAPTITPMHAQFVDSERATHYTVTVTATAGTPTATWAQTPPADNTSCKNFAPVGSTPGTNGVTFEAVWKHSDADGCTHTSTQHLGTVSITVKEGPFICTAAIVGTLTLDGPAPPPCAEPNCDKEKLAVATAQGKVDALQAALDALRASTVDPAIARVNAAAQGLQDAAYDWDHTWKANNWGRKYKGAGPGSSVSGALDFAQNELKEALAQLQAARAAYKELANQLKAAQAELDAAQKALTKCLNGGVPDRKPASASPAAMPTVDCSAQQDAATTTQGASAGFVAVGRLLRPTTLARTGPELRAALVQIRAVHAYVAASSKGRQYAAQLGKLLAVAGSASTSVNRVVGAQQGFTAKAAAAAAGAAKARAALQKCQSGG